jgi:hypothetical protein
VKKIQVCAPTPVIVRVKGLDSGIAAVTDGYLGQSAKQSRGAVCRCGANSANQLPRDVR